MITIQMLRAMSVTVLGVVLFQTPTLAEFDHRAAVPSIQAPQHEGMFEGRPAEMDSRHPYRLSLSPDFHPGRDLNVKNGEWRASGFRNPNISHWPSMNMRPGQIPAYDVGDTGIPMWRW